MSDVRDPVQFAKVWEWGRLGLYDRFPRGCAFTNLDSFTEFDGRALLIENKHHDGTGHCPYPKNGQMGCFRWMIKRGCTVLVLYGDPERDWPRAVRILGPDHGADEFIDWRDLPQPDALAAAMRLIWDVLGV